MYSVSKRMEIAGCHHLSLDYKSPCERMHGHNWIVTVTVEGETLNQNEILMDFKMIKESIHGKLDHENLSELFEFNPTAERIAQWIFEELQTRLNIEWFDLPMAYDTPHVVEVKVQESEGNIACYRN